MLIDQRQLTLNFDPQPARLRRAVPIIVRRVALRGQISELHARAFCEANAIGLGNAR